MSTADLVAGSLTLIHAVTLATTGQVLDFLDTIFIVIRKRTRQLSFLHVFHHMSIFAVYWINISIACAHPRCATRLLPLNAPSLH